MIPKIIHYCWFGKKPKQSIIYRCIDSWYKYCKDFEIIEHNESNYDISNSFEFVKTAYDKKQYAFVSDAVRYDVVYNTGGIYFDCDVELIKPIDEYLKYDGFFAFEREVQNSQSFKIATGLGFGAIKYSNIIKEYLELYKASNFDMTACTIRERNILTKYGIILNGKDQLFNNIRILNANVFCPKGYVDNKICITSDTHGIHWYTASWKPINERVLRYRQILNDRSKLNF